LSTAPDGEPDLGTAGDAVCVDDRLVAVAGQTLECRLIDARNADAPWLVFLHEGLGSVSLWKDFPASVCAASGARALVYSRAGYGRSSPADLPRRVGYMHREAQTVLPALLDALSIRDPVLVGHSDGASIALIYAGSRLQRVQGLVVLAPHVFIEELSIESIAAAGAAHATTDLPERLARHHDDAGAAFRGWNDIWLAAEFRHWNIEEYLRRVECPVLAIQGEDDEYGTMTQLEAVTGQVLGPVRELRLADCRHSPHRDRPEATREAIVTFSAALGARRSA
jgi:pimeloyl-ACP methyl ester carboxylesterase